METAGPKRVELLLPMRTVLMAAAAIGVIAAFVAIGSTFLVVFMGIFLALVFEFPVRLVINKTGLSRGLAATITVLGAALVVLVLALLLLAPIVGGVRDFLHGLPATVEQLRASDELSWLDTGAGENVQSGAEKVAASVPDAISEVLGIAGSFFSVFVASFTILFVCLFLLTDVGNLKRALASVLMPGEDDRGHHPGGDRLAPRLELRGRPRRHRRAARHDSQPRRDHRRLHPGARHLGRGGDRAGADHAGRRTRLPAGREQRADAEDPGQGRQPLRLLHHRGGHALRRPARRARRADGSSAGRDDPDLRPGADEGATYEGGGRQGRRRTPRRHVGARSPRLR